MYIEVVTRWTEARTAARWLIVPFIGQCARGAVYMRCRA
nr:MAG TPA: hypothetical protein [Inoviridae sp.]